MDWLFVLLPKCLGNVVVKRRNEKQNTEKKHPFCGGKNRDLTRSWLSWLFDFFNRFSWVAFFSFHSFFGGVSAFSWLS